MLGLRRLEPEEYKQIDDKLSVARKAMVDRETKVKDAIEEVECELRILGATAVEDRLQEEVPETISALLAAGIKVHKNNTDSQAGNQAPWL